MDNIEKWPVSNHHHNHVVECMVISNSRGITFTSSNIGTLNGNGPTWWGWISYLTRSTNRPRMMKVQNCTDILLEHWHFYDSPHQTTKWADVANFTARHVHIENRRNDKPNHDLWNLGAFNTDGFDISGRDIHIHDCFIWNQDDCIAVKPLDGKGINSQCSKNMLFERLTASGLGLTIGSVGVSPDHTCVQNITFRDNIMPNTYKGIYIKSRPSDPKPGTGEISNVLYQNITITEPEQWGIWIGPQQAIYDGACSLLWPFWPFSKCPTTDKLSFSNITLKDILITDPKNSPGVILGSSTNPMKGIVFDNVTVTNADKGPWYKDYYKCEGVEGSTALGGTSPVPPCFDDKNLLGNS